MTHLLYISSHTIIVSILSAMYHQLPDMVVVASSVMATSLWYWKDPKENSLPQLLDRVLARSAILYVFYHSTPFDYTLVFYYISFCTGLLSYIVARVISTKNKDMSHYIHCGLHLCGNLSNIIIFPHIAAKRIV